MCGSPTSRRQSARGLSVRGGGDSSGFGSARGRSCYGGRRCRAGAGGEPPAQGFLNHSRYPSFLVADDVLHRSVHDTTYSVQRVGFENHQRAAWQYENVWY